MAAEHNLVQILAELGKDAVELLISDDPKTASITSQEINKSNEERKGLDRSITEEALALIENNEELKKRKSTVLFSPDWHKGVIGIVASRLTETYYRPTIILTESKGFATGSARSIDGFDLYKAIDACSDLLENFGGHMYAAGLTMKLENVEKFTEKFEKYVAENILPEQLVPQIDVDAEIHLSNINIALYRTLCKFEPFGPGNMKPVFVTNDVFDLGTSKVVGKDRNHLKLEIIEAHRRDTISGVAFGMGDKFDSIHGGSPFGVCYTIEENDFKGVKSLQILVKDIHTNNSENK